MTGIDTSGLEQIATELDRIGPAYTRTFCARYPTELAKFRSRHHHLVGLHPVPVNGSTQRGLRSGYYQMRLRDGTLGYFQRRTDDCVQAALASLLQMPIHRVPDLHIERQIAAGKEPDLIERNIEQQMSRWKSKHGITLTYHPARLPTSSRRWIGVTHAESDYSDHCLLMTGRDCLFDPASPIPPMKDRPVTAYDIGDIAYAITIT